MCLAVQMCFITDECSRENFCGVDVAVICIFVISLSLSGFLLNIHPFYLLGARK